jgi:RNA polymerase sigma-70 factor (TIGR02943 family)
MATPDPEKWVNEYSDILLKFAYTRVNNSDLAKDLVQDTYFSALKNLESFRGEASEKNWLFLILKNKITDHYRKQASGSLNSDNSAGSVSQDIFDENGHWYKETLPADWNINYDSVIDSDEFSKTFGNCKNKLPELQNLVFCLKYIDEEKSDEICMKLGITSSNYWIMIHRAKLHLRKCLEKNWFRSNKKN